MTVDPTAALREIRSLTADPTEDPDLLAELVTALDQWLTRGGYLPAQWTR